jgi:hypothetical protein
VHNPALPLLLERWNKELLDAFALLPDSKNSPDAKSLSSKIHHVQSDISRMIDYIAMED